MSAPDRVPHERWRLTRHDGRSLVVKFASGISLDELRILHRGFASYSPIIGTRVDGVQDDDGGDDAQVAI